MISLGEALRTDIERRVNYDADFNSKSNQQKPQGIIRHSQTDAGHRDADKRIPRPNAFQLIVHELSYQ